MRFKENTFIRILASLALSSCINFAFLLRFSLFDLLLLSLSATAFPKVEFLEALGDLSIVDLVIFKTICFNVMYQLT